MDFVQLTSPQSYTAVFKLEVAIYAEENGDNMAAQRKYGVNEKVIRGLCKQKETLRMTKKSRKAFRVHAPHCRH